MEQYSLRQKVIHSTGGHAIGVICLFDCSGKRFLGFWDCGKQSHSFQTVDTHCATEEHAKLSMFCSQKLQWLFFPTANLRMNTDKKFLLMQMLSQSVNELYRCLEELYLGTPEGKHEQQEFFTLISNIPNVPTKVARCWHETPSCAGQA